MTSAWIYILPFAAALAYVVSALSLKRSADLGAGLWHTTFVSNIVAAFGFQVLLVFGGHWQPLAQWWQPFVVALLFVSGQVWALLALQRGDVSISTPVLGLKVILVAGFTTLILAQKLSWQMWLAAVLTTSGIACLNHSGAHKAGSNATGTIVAAGLAAASFALFDVLVQKWSPVWGLGRFLPLMVAMTGILTLGLIPLFPSPIRSLPAQTRRWLLVGGSLFAFQSILLVSSIARYGQATPANVIYSSRGLWSILAVAFLGHWFHSTESHLGGSIMRWRFLGASLMFAAIVLVLI
jgi:drug/metabolite transporter (DMT)-like permease